MHRRDARDRTPFISISITGMGGVTQPPFVEDLVEDILEQVWETVRDATRPRDRRKRTKDDEEELI
jgi:hypothetical protein